MRINYGKIKKTWSIKEEIYLGLPVIHEYHHDLIRVVQQIAQICLSEEFIALKKELEELYAGTPQTERAFTTAFQDALYTMIAQEEIEMHNTSA
jgi:hypothetical protein